MSESKASESKAKTRWVCVVCASAKEARNKPKRCQVCGARFKDVSELEDRRDPYGSC